MRALVLLFSAAIASGAAAQPVRLAAPGLNAVNLDEAIASFFSEHFAQQMALRGLSVVTSAEIATLIGLERQRQLVGCSDESGACLTEIADALGVEALLTGSIARFGNTLQANLKVIRASDARPLALVSRTANTDDAMMHALADAAQVAATEVLGALRPGEKAELDQSRAGLGPLLYRVTRNNVLQLDLLAVVVGVYGLEYERVLTDFFSLAVRAQYLAFRVSIPDTEPPARGLDFSVGPRLYPWRRSPSGLWFSPELRSGQLWSGEPRTYVGVGTAVGWSVVGDAVPFVFSLSAALTMYPVGLSPIAIPYDARASASVGWAF